MPLSECRECDREISTEARVCPHCGVPGPTREQGAEGEDFREPQEYYREQFRRFEENGGNYVFTWNWPAFIFGVFWYLYRGMWGKALILAALTLFSGGILFVLAWFYCGAVGNYDYYLLTTKGTQWWPTGG